MAKCPRCFSTDVSGHKGLSCDQFRAKKVTETMPLERQKAAEIRGVDASETFFCPVCFEVSFKGSGCNHATCTNVAAHPNRRLVHSCKICNQNIDPDYTNDENIIYSHFDVFINGKLWTPAMVAPAETVEQTTGQCVCKGCESSPDAGFWGCDQFDLRHNHNI